MLWGLESSRSLSPALNSGAPSLPASRAPQASCQFTASGGGARWGGLWGEAASPDVTYAAAAACPHPGSPVQDRLYPEAREEMDVFSLSCLKCVYSPRYY